MRPLLVLLLVAAALGAFFLAMQAGDDGNSEAESIEGPGVATVATPDSDEGSGPIEDLSSPDSEREKIDTPVAMEEPQRADLAGELVNAVSGSVRLEDGTPVANATVILTQFGQSQIFFDPTNEERTSDRTTKTNAQGEFLFPEVETGTSFSLIANHAEHGRREEGHIELREGQVIEGVVITLGGGVRLYGTLTDTSGAYVDGARVLLSPTAIGAFGDNATNPNTSVVSSDEQGVYEFKNVANGNYTLTVVKDGYGRVSLPQLNIADEDLEHDLVLDVAHMIGGMVQSEDGMPVAEAKVQVFSMSSRKQTTRSEVSTDENGEFLFDDIREGSYTLLVRAKGYKGERKQRVETGDMAVALQLTALPKVRGRVLDPEGRPVKNFTVQLRQAVQGSTTTMAFPDTRTRIRNAENGEYELSCPNQGNYIVEAIHQNFAPCVSEDFSIVHGQEINGIDVQMSLGGTIRGRVVDAEGRPIGGARVMTHDNDFVDDMFWRSLGQFPSQATEKEVRTDEQGQFELTALSPATYQLDVRHADFSKHIERSIVVQEGQPSEVKDIRLSRGASLSGMVLGPSSKGISGAIVQLQMEATGDDEIPMQFTARTNGDGSYSFEHIPAGTYDVYAQRRGGGNPFQGSLDVKATKRRIVIREGDSYNEDFNITN